MGRRRQDGSGGCRGHRGFDAVLGASAPLVGDGQRERVGGIGGLRRGREPQDPGVNVICGDIGDAVATALDAAGGKNLEILGADVAAQCFQRGLVDEVLVYVLPVLLGDGVRFSAPGMTRTELEPLSSRRSGDTTILRFRVRK